MVLKNLKNPKAFIDYSQAIDGLYEDLKDYNPTKKRKMLITFDDIIVDIEANKIRPVYWNEYKNKKGE